MLPAQVNYWTLQENKRHNVATEEIQSRAQMEEARHNKVYEGETHRHNFVTENETMRHNVATERVQASQVALGWSQLSESTRHNKMMEGVQKQQAATQRMLGFETIRHNRTSEKLGRQQATAKTFTDILNAEARVIDAVIPL